MPDANPTRREKRLEHTIKTPRELALESYVQRLADRLALAWAVLEDWSMDAFAEDSRLQMQTLVQFQAMLLGSDEVSDTERKLVRTGPFYAQGKEVVRELMKARAKQISAS